MWVYCTDKIKLYDYAQTRNGQNAVNFLNGFNGYLVCDGYDGYNKLSDVTRCGCWAHARRKFFEALPEDENIRKISKANIGFEMINKIFALEREFAELDLNERQKQRQERTKPILDDFYSWLSTLNPSKDSGLAKAVQYALNEKKISFRVS